LFGCATTIKRKPRPPGEQRKAKPGARSSAASKGTSCAKSTPHSARQNQLKFLLDDHRSINALAETINGLYKTEVIHRRGPWHSFEAVEFATLEWVEWFNNRRLLAPIGYIPPAEAEGRYHASLDQPAMAA
jgi:transposase InsO family protein